jgi:tetratricopeptide (TPR) repeat protein
MNLITRIFAIALMFSVCFTSVHAEAQTRDEKIGWHRNTGSSQYIEKGREAKTEFDFKMDMEFETTVVRKRSENARACARHAANPKPTDISFCQNALLEPDLSPENRYVSTYNMGLMQFAFEDYDMASETLLNASTLSPEKSEPLTALAKLAIKRGDEVAAKTYITKALANNPARPTQAYITLGYLHERDFEFEEARAAYEAALASKGSPGEARRRLERINRLWPAK